MIQAKQKREKGKMRTKHLKRKGARNLRQIKELVRGVYGRDIIVYLMTLLRPLSFKEQSCAV